jgi:flagellar hook-length control protein FliK
VTTNPQVQIAVATPAVAAAIAQGTTRADAQSTPIDPAQSFAIELEAPTTEGTPHAQPSNSTPTAARPQPAAPAPVAAQLVAQGQAVDATAQAQATAPTGPAAASLAKANSDAPALAVAEAGAFAARKDAPDGALAAQPAAQPARAEATPEAAAARGARVPAHPAVAQVAVSVAKAAQDGVERITIKLQPPELGRIDVKIEVGVDGRIQAVFAAERAATVDILQREVRELERALQGAGLDAGGGLSFGLKQNGGNGGHGAYAGLERGQGGSGRGAPEDDSRQQQQPRRMATADGRVDIHV